MGLKEFYMVIEWGKQVIKVVNKSNRGPVCLFSQKETTMLVVQNIQFKFR